MKKYHYPTIKERNQAIRNYIDSLVGKARRNEKSKLLLKGVSNSFWTIAKRNGYIINISRGVFDPTIEFTDEIINYLYAEANKYVNYMPESVLQNIQAEIWSSTPVPDVSFDEMKPQRINPITIEELITDMENLWIKLNEYAKTQKP